MRFQIRTFVEFFALSTYLLIAFAVIGAPIKVLLRSLGIKIGRLVPAPMLGMAVVALASWYWALPHGGTKPLVRWLLAASAALLVIGVLARGPAVFGRSARRFAKEEHVRRAAALALVSLLGVGVMTTVLDTQLFTRQHFTVLSLGNNDAPSYALVAQHMLDQGPRVYGNVAGYNVGDRQLAFPTGALADLAGSASMTGQEVWKVMQPSMFVALVLAVYATALLLSEILGHRYTVACGLAALSGFAVFYMSYVVGEWFYAQILGIGLATTILAVTFRGVREQQWRERLVGVALLGVLLATGFAVYPHMVIFGTVTLLPVAAIVDRSLVALLRRGLATIAYYGFGFLVAAGLAPGLLSDAIKVARELKSVEAGWALPAIVPTDMLGFQTFAGAKHSGVAVAISVAIFAIVGVLAVVSWRRGLGASMAPLVVMIAVIFGSYVVAYHREGGPSYRQWKWLTFLLPLFVAATVMIVAVALLSARRYVRLARPAGYAVLASHASVALLLSTAAGFSLTPGGYVSVSLDQINVRYDPQLSSIDSLDIDVNPYWDTMWLAYFLRDKKLSLAQPTYYGQSPPISNWHIERNDRPLPPGEAALPINTTYRLVRVGK